MELYLSNDWLGAADYREGSPQTTLGSSRLPPAVFAARVTAPSTASSTRFAGSTAPMDGPP